MEDDDEPDLPCTELAALNEAIVANAAKLKVVNVMIRRGRLLSRDALEQSIVWTIRELHKVT